MFRPKKRLGQNFLTDKNYLARIVDSAQITRDETIFEIGPGKGHLTRLLLERARNVIAVEIDDELISILQGELVDYENLCLINADAIKADWHEIMAENQVQEKAKLVANIPYYITTPIIEKAISSRDLFSTCLMTVQQEVGKRICAPPGGKEYGSLSLMVQFHCETRRLFDIPSQAFAPRPDVVSTVIEMRFREHPAVQVEDEAVLFRVIRVSFQQRRKMIKNSLKSLDLPESAILGALHRADVPTDNRAERLSLEEFGRLSDQITFLLR
jgi:16S rRNA (adenine1518-N6/adenine1519-N6)-dimethyltransferase